ncbi:MAG: hypothetical protein AB7T22_15675 [Calditrichaceae bacterium]
MKNKIIDIIERLKSKFRSYFTELKKDNHTLRKFLISFFPPVVIVLLIFLILPLTCTSNETHSSENSANDKKSDKKSESGLRELETEEQFWKNRIQLAKDDSIYLVVNLRDSLAILEIKGVPLRESRIITYDKSTLLTARNRFGKVSSPYTLQKDWATITKAPIKVKIAPKDTIEAGKAEQQQIYNKESDVNFTLLFDHHMRIEFRQSDESFIHKRLHFIYYHLKSVYFQLSGDFAELYHLKPPVTQLWLELNLSKEDTKAIYRALPENAKMLIYL